MRLKSHIPNSPVGSSKAEKRNLNLAFNFQIFDSWNKTYVHVMTDCYIIFSRHFPFAALESLFPTPPLCCVPFQGTQQRAPSPSACSCVRWWELATDGTMGAITSHFLPRVPVSYFPCAACNCLSSGSCGHASWVPFPERMWFIGSTELALAKWGSPYQANYAYALRKTEGNYWLTGDT